MLDDVKFLVDMGFAVHLLRPKSKAPLDDAWSTAPVYTFRELKERYRRGMNLGVRLGKPSRIGDHYLHAIDLDIRDPELADEAVETLRSMFGKLGLNRMWTVRSGSGKLSRHYYFLCDTHFPTQNLAKSDEFTEVNGRRRRAWEIDLLGTGKQIVLPPSIHDETGNAYQWLIEPDDEFPVEIDSDDLTDLLEPEEYHGEQDREPLGISLEEAEQWLEALDGWENDHATWRDVGMALKHEFGEDGWKLFDAWSKKGRGYNRKDNRYQWERFDHEDRGSRDIITMRTIGYVAREAELEDLIDELDDGDVVREEVETVKEAAQKAKERAKGDPDMSILLGGNKQAPRLPLSILGKRMVSIIKKQAKSAATSEDFVFASVLAGASAVMGNSVRVQIRPGFTQTPILWCQMIGDPSTNKSPAARVVTSALHALEKRYEPFYRQALKAWEIAAEKAEGRLKAYEARKKAIQAEGKDWDEERPEDSYAPPRPPKRPFIHNDVTVEYFIQEQSRAPRGFMIFRDELAGWLGSMERYSQSTDRPMWLESYDGGTFKVGRVKTGDEATVVERICAPVLGGIQPERLMQIIGESDVDDGLQARFLPFWPDMAFREMAGESEDSLPLIETYQRLSEIEMTKLENGAFEPQIVKFTDQAFAAFKRWSDNRKKQEMNAPVKLRGVFGKAEGQVARIAAVLQFLWWAADDVLGEDDPPAQITTEAVKAAIRFREEYLKPMQARVYRQTVEPDEVVNARVIANWIIAEDIVETNMRQIRRESGVKGLRGGASERTKEETIEAAIKVLIHARWLKAEKAESGPKGGRPSVRYYVNERVFDLVK